MSDFDYIEKNRLAWNRKTGFHIASQFYDNESFLKGKSTLKDIELQLLGNVAGKSILHLQCHFGQDSISLARMGAAVTGVDLSDKAIEHAGLYAAQTNVNTQFICCNIYDLPQHLNQQFDIVFTSYGTIGWLHDLNQWGDIVSRYLKPGGRFIFAEFHPFVWAFDNDFNEVTYRYFKTDPIIETETGTYADKNADLVTESVSWNHGIGEVLTALISNGLSIDSFEEFDYSPYNCFNHTIEEEPGKFRIKKFGNKIPMMYALSATKKII